MLLDVFLINKLSFFQIIQGWSWDIKLLPWHLNGFVQEIIFILLF